MEDQLVMVSCLVRAICDEGVVIGLLYRHVLLIALLFTEHRLFFC